MRVPNRVKFFASGPLYEVIHPRLPGQPHRVALDAVGKQPGTTLDLCAGSGYLARRVAAASPDARVTAIDLSPEMLADGRRRAERAGVASRVTFVRGDATALKLDDASFDTVVTSFALHELKAAQRDAMLAETHRVLRPGGRLIVVDLDAPARRSTANEVFLRVMEPRAAREVFGTGIVDAARRAGMEVREHVSSLGHPVLPFQLVEAVRPY